MAHPDHTNIGCSVATREALDAIVAELRARGRTQTSRASVVGDLATIYGEALIHHLTEPATVGRREPQ